ncbi:50S ribosomal protein L10 [Methanospirillum stamsii]|uniref:Large ribosomal subunit protein uL10 n=1 Tax=Methanospirillum stamsii TaxID=1277351 RepID=A0A2V2MWI0_9EURY|nr:50S ribosomal protein L10 [Methanospirillum stamsii]PWR69766.1 50S ribosomal protein L10 [Methanospirillum stamsii]
MGLYTVHLPQWKKDEISEIKRLASEYKLVGLVDMYGIPAKQVQDIRRNLRGKAELKMTRNTLIEHAFGEQGDLGELSSRLSGHSALIFTNENPFKLYSMLEKTKTKMAARPGETAPEDIVISKGPTSFRPGPIVGELQQAGIPAAIEAGKVTIRETKTVVKAGQEINKKLADALVKLDIKPMDVGLALQAAFYEGSVYEADVLAIDETAFYNSIISAATHAFNLSVNACYPTKDTAGAIITKAVREARGVAVEAAVASNDVIDAVLGRAQAQAMALQNITG